MRFLPLSVALSALLSLPALAQPESSEHEGPYFLLQGLPSGRALGLVDSRAVFSVAGVITRVQLTQVYENHSAQPIEANYVFPVSTGAAVHGMRVRIGHRVLEAKIDKKAAARRAYEDARDDGRQAGLLEQHRPNVLQMHVANIRPGDKIEVQIDYTELMSPTDGIYELVIPAVVGPRYTGESKAQEQWTNNPHVAPGQPSPFTWKMSGQLRAGLEIAALSSPSHTVSPRFLSRQGVAVEVLDEDGADRDFILKYRLGGSGIETGLLMFPGEDEQFFLLTVAPPRRVAPTQVVPREYVFIVDVSGSMSGFPIETSKALLRNLVHGLGPQDRFNVVLFAGASKVMAEESVPTTVAHLKEAEELISGMRGGGGTQVLAALKQAFALPRSAELSTSFVLITDGYVSVEREALELVSQHLNEANLFTFGIGTSVNRHLIETLARAGMGNPFVVLKSSEAEAQAAKFAEYVAQPVLTHISVDFEGFDVLEVEPQSYPDLFASRPVTIFGKYRGQPSGRITVRGRVGEGEFVHSVPVVAEAASDDLGALRHLWARHRVQRLSDQDDASGGAQHEAEITQLGLKYKLLTHYTSFVAIGDQRVVHGAQRVTQLRPGATVIQGAPLSGEGTGSSYGLGGLGTRGVGVGGGGGVGYGHGGVASMSMGRGKIGRVAGGEVSNSAPAVMGSMDNSGLLRVIRRHQAAFRRVYERALAKNPALSGKLVFKFTVGPDGRVTAAEVTEDSLNDPQVKAALIKLVRRMRFAKPAGGGSVTVSYPMLFRPS